MRMLMALIGYTSTATVLAGVLALGYLWRTERVDQEKAFRILALVHDVDLTELDSEASSDAKPSPGEGALMANSSKAHGVLPRNSEAQLEALQRGRQEFDHRYTQLRSESDRFDEVAQKIGKELQRQSELARQEAVSKVVRDLEAVQEETAKTLLLKTKRQPDGINDVILLMNAMSTSKLRDVLQRFGPEEIDSLHEIHRALLERGYDETAGVLGSANVGQ